MPQITPLSGLPSPLRRPVELIQLFRHLVSGQAQSYYPEADHKSRWEVFKDHIAWIFRHKEINRFYYVYGMDRKHTREEQQKLGYRHFRSLRDKGNIHPPGVNFNYASLLRDKFIFGQLMSSLGFPTPKNIALLDKQSFTNLETMETLPLTALKEKPVKVEGFCKLLTGIKGEGAFRLQISNGILMSNGEELTVEQLQEKLEGPYLLQELITQHTALATLHPTSVNTVRMITFNNKGIIQVFCATLRIGTCGRSVDNWASGGIVVAIDPENGQLRKEGFFKPGFGGRVTEHPDTGIKLEGYQIPFFKESVETACRLHRYFYGFHSVGWDIATTDKGPVFIEGNEDWDGTIPMTLEPDFKDKFLKMFPS